MNNAAESKQSKPSMFQVLLLDNDASQDVAVQEAEQVDFCVVKEHLQNGGSVFITCKDTQKIEYPKTKAQTNHLRSRKNTSFIFGNV